MSTLQGICKPYPLYDELVRRVNERIDKSIDIKRICTTINNIWQTLPTEEAMKHYEELGALVLHHELVNNNGLVLSMTPYNAKIMFGDKGILYTIINIPPNLQQIIAQYIEDPNLEK